MELGELVKVDIPDVKLDQKCPFSHEKPNPDEKNELGGIGTRLGESMATGKGVHTSKPPVGADLTTGSKEPDPRVRPGKQKLTFVFIEVGGEKITLDGESLPYPVTCAAHHLVPAQESLKEHPVLRYMCKDGEKQDFRSSGSEEPAVVKDSKVWGNVAYNVNGRHNGVWLPGNYAVGAGAAGVEVWKSRASRKRKTYSDDEAAENWEKALDLGSAPWTQLSKDPVEEEGPQPASLASALAEASGAEYMLVGDNYHIVPGNPKWAYVKATMDAVGGQFHDRHKDYSDEVQTYLKKINAVYNTLYDRSTEKVEDGGCNKCAEAVRPAKAKASLVGPPYTIVARLVAASEFFKGFVQTQVITAKNIYTSKWVLEWMATKKKKI